MLSRCFRPLLSSRVGNKRIFGLGPQLLQTQGEVERASGGDRKEEPTPAKAEDKPKSEESRAESTPSSPPEPSFEQSRTSSPLPHRASSRAEPRLYGGDDVAPEIDGQKQQEYWMRAAGEEEEKKGRERPPPTQSAPEKVEDNSEEVSQKDPYIQPAILASPIVALYEAKLRDVERELQNSKAEKTTALEDKEALEVRIAYLEAHADELKDMREEVEKNHYSWEARMRTIEALPVVIGAAVSGLGVYVLTRGNQQAMVTDHKRKLQEHDIWWNRRLEGSQNAYQAEVEYRVKLERDIQRLQEELNDAKGAWMVLAGQRWL